MKRPLPVHPFLFGLVPVLFEYAHNAVRIPISPRELLLPVFLILFATLILLLILALVLRNAWRAAIVASAVVLLFFLFGHVLRLLGPRGVSELALLIFFAIAAGAGVVTALLLRRGLPELTMVLNVVAFALVLLNAGAGLWTLSLRPPSQIRPGTVRAQADSSRSGLPDIYYIVLDMYGRSDILRSDYHFDNTDFVSFLEQRGFFVADRSLSNYAQTYPSLASALNVTYLDSVRDQAGIYSHDEKPLLRMIGHSRVVEFLKARGYRVVSFASGYTGTDLADADTHLAPRLALSEFQDLLLSTTALPALLGPKLGTLQDESHRQRILYTLRMIPNAASGRRPVFVFAHIVCPHTPFVFDAQGKRPNIIPYLRINQTGTTRQTSRAQVRKWFIENYGPQVTYLDQLLETAIEQILSRASDSSIIIIQGDHGPGQIATIDEMTREDMVKRQAILSAVYLPAQARSVPFYDSISPVNTFRLLLSHYFDTSLARLPDRSYFSSLNDPYLFYDLEDSSFGQVPIDPIALRGRLDVLAFASGRALPAKPSWYCSRLIARKYPRQRKLIGRAIMRSTAQSLTVEQAYARYRELVAAGDMPDLGTSYDGYHGPGPDRGMVTALFFVPATGFR